jgi:conjugal transfer pilus assembly protein TraD
MQKNQKQQSDDILVHTVGLLVDLVVSVVGLLLKSFWRLVTWIFKKMLITDKEKGQKPVSVDDLSSKKKVNRQNVLGYSINNQDSFKAEYHNSTRHTAVIGTTGSGKTVCLRSLIDVSLSKKQPVIYFDPKPSLQNVNIFRDIAEAKGIRYYDFTDIYRGFFGFNPLENGSLEDISDRIINALEWSEPFYKNESIQALDLALMKLDESGRAITFKNIAKELNKSPNIKNIKGLLNQIEKINNCKYSDMINAESGLRLTFDQVRREGACLYIGISFMGNSSTGHILNKVFFGSLLTHAKESLLGKVEGISNPEEKPVSIVFDELSSTIHEGFIDLQNKCRQAGMELTYATQTPSDIDRISPVLREQILENTNSFYIFNQTLPSHTELFSRMIGTYTSEKKTHALEDDELTSLGSVREVEEFRVHGNIFRGLNVGQCVFFQRNPRRVDLLNMKHFVTQSGMHPWPTKLVEEVGLNKL